MTGSPRVLVVEDRASLRRMLVRALEGKGYEVVEAADAESAFELIPERRFDCVLSDLELPGASGIEVVRATGEEQPETPVVVLTAFGTIERAVEAMKAGAVDFLEKPVELEDLFDLVRRLTAEPPKADVFRATPNAPPIVGSHPQLRAALHLLERVAPTEATVLLTGESGTGKELFARALHLLSKRAAGPFVAVNCAAIPESLMENELFGHEKGAFTGAHRQQAGRFERADGGTLLLDEIGELSAAVQGKILRVLEERTYERVGGGGTRTADVRLVAATNRDLGEMVAAGTFRSDLYYRLDVFPVHLPPLRERRSDIPALAAHLVEELAARHGVEPPLFDPEAMDLVASRPWPGNVRQLGNLLERAVILHAGSRVGAGDLEKLLGTATPDEREEVRSALQEADGDKRRAAEILGVSYRTLQRKVKKHDLEGYPRYRD